MRFWRLVVVTALVASCSDGAIVLEHRDGGTAAAPYDYCAELPPLSRAPRLDDGLVDEALPLAEVPATTWIPFEDDPFPAGWSARIAAAWNPGGLYVFFDVTDPDLVPALATDMVWFGDGVEVYVDHDGVLTAPPGYDDPGTRHLLYGAPLDNVTSQARVERTSVIDTPSLPWPGSLGIARPRAGGYTVEVLVRAHDLDLPSWTLAAGGQVGFDVSFNVSYPVRTATPQGSRMGSFVLRADPARPIPDGFPFNTSVAFCRPTLRAQR